jgi:hypothetical protein
VDCHAIVLSMCGKAEPDDTALMERFVGTLTVACVQRHDFQTPTQARACIFADLAVFSNRQRLHSSLGYRSPLAFAHAPALTCLFHPSTQSGQPQSCPCTYV